MFDKKEYRKNWLKTKKGQAYLMEQKGYQNEWYKKNRKKWNEYMGKRQRKMGFCMNRINRKKGNKPKNWESLYTPEINEKRRLARLKQRFLMTDTSIELKTKKWLEDKNIKYFHPFNLGNRFQCDFYLPLLNLIVECDGEYWHNLPKAIMRDERKDICAKELGFNILRLSEEQINQGRFPSFLREEEKIVIISNLISLLSWKISQVNKSYWRSWTSIQAQ